MPERAGVPVIGTEVIGSGIIGSGIIGITGVSGSLFMSGIKHLRQKRRREIRKSIMPEFITGRAVCA